MAITFLKQATTQVIQPLKLIYSKSSGYIASVTFFGYEYYIIFIENFSKYTIIRLLQYKSKYLHIFKIFYNWFENQTSYKIKKKNYY